MPSRRFYREDILQGTYPKSSKFLEETPKSLNISVREWFRIVYTINN